MCMKTDIDALCKDLMMDKLDGFVSVPVVLMVYLGEETYQIANASIQDAFATSFKIEPNVYDIKIDSNDIQSADLLQKIVDAITAHKNLGKTCDDIRISFVSVMDDAFYQNVNVQVVDTIREALTNFQNFKLGTPQVSFYGIFRQSKMGANYDAAFRFINAPRR